jgi:glutamate dehydrogenase
VGTKESVARAELIGRIVRRAAERLDEQKTERFRIFVEQYFGRTDAADLAGRPVADVYGMAMAHLALGQTRKPGEARVRIYAPDYDQHGFSSPHSIADIVSDDMPFLVDSVTMELSRRGLGLHLVIHPVVGVSRTPDGELSEVAPASGGIPESDDVVAESFLHVEFDRHTDPGFLEELREDLLRVLADVRAAVEDWQEMRAKALELSDELRAAAEIAGEEDGDKAEPGQGRAEAAALLRWLTDGHFIFLGYREYQLVDDVAGLSLEAVSGSGLGILSESLGRPASHAFAMLPAEVRRKAREANVLNITKANSRSTVHRPSYLDYIGVKRLDENGEVTAERRFLGLYTTAVYKQWPNEIPIVREKAAAVAARAGFAPDSHSGKALAEAIDSYPRDELFQIGTDDLFDAAMAIISLQDRQRVKLLVRRDDFGRFVSCLVYVPRARLGATNEQVIQEMLQQAFGGVHLEYSTRLTESVLARLHLVIWTDQASVPPYDVSELESRLSRLLSSFEDDLHQALVEEVGEERAVGLFRKYRSAFPPAYTDTCSSREALADVRRMEQLESRSGFDVNLYRPVEAGEHSLRLKLYRTGQPVMLSSVLPLLENMGLRVADERPHEVMPAGSEPVWIYDFGLISPEQIDIEVPGLRHRFHEAFRAVALSEAENDGLNRLVLGAGLSGREIIVLRTYARYLRQTGMTFSLEYVAAALSASPAIAAQLVQLFRIYFDPDFGPTEERELAGKSLGEAIERGLDAVENLNEDLVLRRLLGTVRASLRTNFFQADAHGQPKAWLSIKLDPSAVPDLPLPKPMFDTFVYSPRTEGVHLRGGRVARGGVRWSDRLEDFRTEVLGLMKAQDVKNAVIVPSGAKGGFVLKSPPAADLDARHAEGVACYQIFIRGLLDLADNLVDEKVVPPRRVVRRDGDDPYLVVAADKGTATFSDLANAISAEYSFWLGDAFASGGSSGYDHKAMAITARGTYVSVKRHFRELGINAERDELTVVGIGDMAGDVFGNGMLLSPHLRLIAAFDHRHIFLDPDPDPAGSFAERRRLFNLPRSSWADYDLASISGGGGVFPRTAKRIPLTPEVKKALATDTSTMRPDEMIRAILTAPVDLLWNGGIGTYVKASGETNAATGDKANDAVRVNGRDLRCRVVGEGGNLGFSQLGRIEYAMAGGRINTDAIDNSAGVDCSDHEVNIKILLDRVIAAGELTLAQRDALLSEMTADVARHVLEDNDAQTRALYNAAAQAASMVDVHARFMSALERTGHLNRVVEFLPTAEELEERNAAGHGLSMPELAVLMAYAKNAVWDELFESDLPEDPSLAGELESYFPPAIRQRFARQMASHPLRREIVVTRLANTMINRGGMTLAFRLREETGFNAPDVARAYTAAWQMMRMQELWEAIEALDYKVAAGVQVQMLLEARKLAERTTRWLLRNRRQPLQIAATVADFVDGLGELAGVLPELVGPGDAAAIEAATARFASAGAPLSTARRVACLPALFSGLDIVDVSRSSKKSIETTAGVYFALGEPLLFDWLRDRIVALPRDDRWQGLARAALREDLYAARAWITSEVLRLDTTPPGAAASAGDVSPAVQVRRWLDQMDVVADRCRVAIDSIAASGQTDLAMLSVALREIRGLVQASTPIPT